MGKYTPRLSETIESEERNSERYKQRALESNKYHCSSCSNCQFDETKLSLTEAGIISSSKEVTALVEIEPHCPHSECATLDHRIVCDDGNRSRKQICSDCIYAEPIECEFKTDSPKIKVFKRLFLCKNSNRAEHYPKGTAFRSYYGCENFEPKT